MSCTRNIGPSTGPTTNAMPLPSRRRCGGPIPPSSSCLGLGCSVLGATSNRPLASEFYVNAINVMRGAEALSSYDPIPESEKFSFEYWGPNENFGAGVPPRPLSARIALVTGAGSGSERPPPAAGQDGPASSSPTSTTMGGLRGQRRVSAAPMWWFLPHRCQLGKPTYPRRCAKRYWHSAASTWWSTTPAFKFPKACSTPPLRIGASSTPLWP